MLKMLLSACAALFLTMPWTGATAAGTAPELFGVSLKGATRASMRPALVAGGLKAKREDDRYWVDVYDATGVLESASEFMAGYVAATGGFAYAEYTFPAFMDTELVGKVIARVVSKYGRPTRRSGNEDLGPVSATWDLGQNMQIEVSRGWPDTTTRLRYSDTTNYRVMRAEIAKLEAENESQKAKAQSKAF